MFSDDLKLKRFHHLKRTTQILNIIYGITVLLFFLEVLTRFDIKSQGIKSYVYYGAFFGSPLILFWNIFVIKPIKRKIIGTIFPAIILTVIFILGPFNLLFSVGTWKTQTILYQHGHLSFKTIEFQMQDIGAFGYNKRTVEVLYLTRFFMTTSEVPAYLEKRVEWIKVNKEINEMELKYP